MNEAHEFPVTVYWRSGKQGTAEVDSLPSVEVSTPPAFGGPEGYWSPEHLYVASVASCLMATFVAIAGNSRLEFADLQVPAAGTVARGEDRRYRVSTVILRPRLTLRRESDRERAGRILEKSHQACIVSNSIRSDVRMEPTVEAVA